MQLVHNPCLFKDFRKNERNKIKMFLSKCNSLIKDGELWRSKNQPRKWSIQKTWVCSKNQDLNTLRINKKNFQYEELPHKLLPTTN